MTQFLILFILAVLVEAIVSLTLGDVPVPGWAKKVASMILGVVFCVLWKVGLIAMLGVEGGIPVVDYVATGIIISRGSNYLNDLLTRVKGSNVTQTTTTTPIMPDSSTTTTTKTTPTVPPLSLL
jgi:hypothetical protein